MEAEADTIWSCWGGWGKNGKEKKLKLQRENDQGLLRPWEPVQGVLTSSSVALG